MFHFDQGQQFLLSIVSFIFLSSSSLDSNSKIFGMEWILVSLGITKFLWLIENWREETIIGVILTIIAEVRIVHKLVEIFFDRRFCDLYGNLIHYHEIFFEFTLLKSAVGIVFSVARFSSKIISTIKRCPILSSSEDKNDAACGERLCHGIAILTVLVRFQYFAYDSLIFILLGILASDFIN